jgi:hypothetical protein
MPTATRSNAAQHAYLAAQRTARSLLARVAAELDGHQECTSHDAIDWGHVGDINRIVQQLQEVVGENAAEELS